MQFKRKTTDDNIGKGEIVREIVIKYRIPFLGIVSLVCLFEVALFIRGLLLFDLTDVRRRLYLISYVLLFLSSAFSAGLLIHSIVKKTVSRFLIGSVYAYCIFLTLWATLISCLDVVGKNTPFVFLTVIMGTAALAFLRPFWYCILAGVLSVFMGGFCHHYGYGTVQRSGFLINFSIFVIITFFIAYRQYGQNRRDYAIMKRLENLSYHDQLTNAYNRLSLQEMLKKANGMFYFGIFDLDNFKQINDTFGHDFGDECLKTVADLLRQYYGEKVFRFGGDEFVVISDLRENEIVEGGMSVNRELNDRFGERHVQVSGGFYCPRKKAETYNDFLKNADRALYRAKTNGKGRIEVFEEGDITE